MVYAPLVNLASYAVLPTLRAASRHGVGLVPAGQQFDEPLPVGLGQLTDGLGNITQGIYGVILSGVDAGFGAVWGFKCAAFCAACFGIIGFWGVFGACSSHATPSFVSFAERLS